MSSWVLAGVALMGVAALADPQRGIDFGANDRVEQEKFQTVIEGLCKDRPKDEYFRLSTESNCRDAVRCVANDFKGGHSLAAVRCPTGLLFDLDGQTCDWAAKVGHGLFIYSFSNMNIAAKGENLLKSHF